MTDVAYFEATRSTDLDVASKPARRKAGWLLMGDIVSQRAGVPEHLIQWCRATGEEDPEPML